MNEQMILRPFDANCYYQNYTVHNCFEGILNHGLHWFTVGIGILLIIFIVLKLIVAKNKQENGE